MRDWKKEFISSSFTVSKLFYAFRFPTHTPSKNTFQQYLSKSDDFLIIYELITNKKKGCNYHLHPLKLIELLTFKQFLLPPFQPRHWHSCWHCA